MKKLPLILGLFAMFFSASAQIKYGAQIGGSFANLWQMNNASVFGSSIQKMSKSDVGLLLGLVAEVPVVDKFSFRPQVNWLQKQYYFTYVNERSRDYKLNYLELPLNIVYTIPVRYGGIMVGAGPSVSMGLNGKVYQGSVTTDVVFDNSPGTKQSNNIYLKQFDFGINVLAGYQLNQGLFVDAGYNFGLSDISTTSDGSALITRGLTVKLGYMLGCRKQPVTEVKNVEQF
jgi:hypothetical protein